MTDRNKTKRMRLLTGLVATLMLLCLFAIPALAEEADEASRQDISTSDSISGSELTVELEEEEEFSQPEDPPVDDLDDDEVDEALPAMSPAMLDAADHSVNNYVDLLDAIDAVEASGQPGVIEIDGRVEIADTVVVPASATITFIGTGGGTIVPEDPGVIFTKNTRLLLIYGTVTLADLVVDGDDVASCIKVDGGELTLQTGAQVTGGSFRGYTSGDFQFNGNGPGVNLQNGAALIIDGGEIHGNLLKVWVQTSAGSGGVGVFSGEGCSVVMNSGSIYNNHIVWNDEYSQGSSQIASMTGGGIFAFRSSSIVLNGGEIYGNSAPYGAGISYSSYDNISSSLEMYEGAVIRDNECRYYGAGIYLLNNAHFTMYGGLITSNLSRSMGSGVYVGSHSTFIMEDGYIVYNAVETAATTQMYNYGGAVALNDISGRTVDTGTGGGGWGSGSVGGGLGRAGGVEDPDFHPNVYLRGGEISYNTTNGWGGAILYKDGGGFAIENTRIIGNYAEMNGGGIHVVNYDDGVRNGFYFEDYFINVRVRNSVMYGNYAGDGAYIFDTGDTVRDGLHSSTVGSNILSWPFDLSLTDDEVNKAYNNLDITYINGTRMDTWDIEFWVDDGQTNERWITSVAPKGTPVGDPTDVYLLQNGMILEGWYTDTTYTTKWDFNDNVTADMRLYAKLVPAPVIDRTVTVQYYAGRALETATYLDTETFSVPDGEDPANHLPAGWLNQHQPAAGYQSGTLASPTSLPGTIASDTEFKVLYIPWEFYVTFDFSQVFNAPYDFEIVEVYFNELVPVQDTTKSGYTFTGWWYEAENRYWSFDTDRMPANEITLVGRWTKDATSGSSSTTSPVTPSESSTSTEGGGGTPPVDSSSSTPTTLQPASSSTVASSSTAVSSSEASSSAASSAAVSEPPAVSSTPEDDYNRDMEGTYVPLNWWQRGDGWSLLNLIVSVLLLLSAVFQIVRMVLAKSRREGEYDNAGVHKKRRLWTIFSAAAGILPIILLFVLENFSGVMLMLDKWTPWFIGFAVLHAAFTVVAFTLQNKWKQTE